MLRTMDIGSLSMVAGMVIAGENVTTDPDPNGRNIQMFVIQH